MSTKNKYAPATNVQPPRCPYCSTELPEISTYQWMKQVTGGLSIMLCLYCPCAECRKVIGTQIMFIPQAAEQGTIVPPC